LGVAVVRLVMAKDGAEGEQRLGTVASRYLPAKAL
jgi:hypothetical protein